MVLTGALAYKIKKPVRLQFVDFSTSVTAARIFFNGPSGNPLSFESLEEIGYQRTYSNNSTITDSAAVSSAWACGEKFNNLEICFHGDGRPNPSSLLELSRAAGMVTGLVATSTVTDATPAAFGAKIQNRNCEKEIDRQYVYVRTPNVILGGGTNIFQSTSKDPYGVSGDFISEAQGEGYVFVNTKVAMEEAVTNGAWKVLGLFSPAGMTPEYIRRDPTAEPRLPEMTKAALDLLSRGLRRSRHRRIRGCSPGGVFMVRGARRAADHTGRRGRPYAYVTRGPESGTRRR